MMIITPYVYMDHSHTIPARIPLTAVFVIEMDDFII